MLNSNTVYCTSPATTPGSLDDEELLPSLRLQKKGAQNEIPLLTKILYSPPHVIITISSLQVNKIFNIIVLTNELFVFVFRSSYSFLQSNLI